MRNLLIVSAAVSIAGCGETTAPLNPTGLSSFAVSGDVSRMVGGEAFFEDVEQGGDPAFWFLHLQRGPPNLHVVEFARRGARPGRGSYELVAARVPQDIPRGQIGAFVSLAPLADPPRAGFAGSATGGTLVITVSEESKIEGTFLLDSTGDVVPPGAEVVPGSVTITGRFEAVQGELVVIDAP
jgi:hypothetical protein